MPLEFCAISFRHIYHYSVSPEPPAYQTVSRLKIQVSAFNTEAARYLNRKRCLGHESFVLLPAITATIHENQHYLQAYVFLIVDTKPSYA
jgi:hypothetical protein